MSGKPLKPQKAWVSHSAKPFLKTPSKTGFPEKIVDEVLALLAKEDTIAARRILAPIALDYTRTQKRYPQELEELLAFLMATELLAAEKEVK